MMVSRNVAAQPIPMFSERSAREPMVDVDTIADESAESLRIRTEMMLCLQQYIDQQRWSLAEACQRLRQPSPRMQNLLNGEIGRFAIEDLIDLLSRVGLTVQLSISSTRLPNLPKFAKNGPDETSLHH
ncbi:MAG: XRE family transcriptional regulator [Cyanobacteria bacterium J06632_22]